MLSRVVVQKSASAKKEGLLENVKEGRKGEGKKQKGRKKRNAQRERKTDQNAKENEKKKRE